MLEVLCLGDGDTNDIVGLLSAHNGEGSLLGGLSSFVGGHLGLLLGLLQGALGGLLGLVGGVLHRVVYRRNAFSSITFGRR